MQVCKNVEIEVWKNRVGITKDVHAFRLMKYLYRAMRSRHEHCNEMQPSNLLKISDRLLQLAATNNTDGSHHNTHRFDAINR